MINNWYSPDRIKAMMSTNVYADIEIEGDYSEELKELVCTAVTNQATGAPS